MGLRRDRAAWAAPLAIASREHGQCRRRGKACKRLELDWVGFVKVAVYAQKPGRERAIPKAEQQDSQAFTLTLPPIPGPTLASEGSRHRGGSGRSPSPHRDLTS